MNFWAIFLLAWLPLASLPRTRCSTTAMCGKFWRIVSCHGQDAETRKGKLRLDEAASALKPRNGAAAIVPGNLEGSEAWQRIITDDADD